MKSSKIREVVELQSSSLVCLSSWMTAYLLPMTPDPGSELCRNLLLIKRRISEYNDVILFLAAHCA